MILRSEQQAYQRRYIKHFAQSFSNLFKSFVKRKEKKIHTKWRCKCSFSFNFLKKFFPFIGKLFNRIPLMRFMLFLSNSVLLFEFVWILYGGNVNIVYPPSCNLNLCCTQIINPPARFSFQFALKRLWGYVVMFQFDRWYYCRDKSHLIRITWMKRHKRTPTMHSMNLCLSSNWLKTLSLK